MMALVDKFKSDVIADTINTLYNELSIVGEGSINLDMPYQREIVWSFDKKKLFIDSIVKHIVPQTIIFNVNSEKGQRECIDGKQRCTSIKQFINNEWPIEIDGTSYFFGPDEKISKQISEKYDKYKIFTPSQRSDFKQIKIPVTTYHDLQYSDQLEIFGRIQNGCPLTEGEKLTAHFSNINSYSEITDFFEKYRNADSIKNYTSFDRKKHHSFLVDIMFYVTEGLKAKSAKNMDTFVSNMAKNTKYLKSSIINCKNVVQYLFNDNVLNHPSICKIKLRKSVLCAIIYHLHKNYKQDLYKKKFKEIRQSIIETNNILHKKKTKISGAESSVKEIYDIFNKSFAKNVLKIETGPESESDEDDDSDEYESAD